MYGGVVVAISFEKHESKLILCYRPELRDSEEFLERIDREEDVILKNAFSLNKEMLQNTEEDVFGEIYFCVGEVMEEYTHIDSNVIMTKHDFFFSNDISLKGNMFVTGQNTSILRKVDQVVGRDVYIGGKWEEHNGIPKELFLELLKKFPKTAELRKYADSRISSILKEHFPECDKYERIYKKFIERKDRPLNYVDMDEGLSYRARISLEQFVVAKDELQEMLNDSEGIKEDTWQRKIHGILRLLYPQYIYCTREIEFRGIDGYDKRPDFILVDANGFIDVLEIKSPNVRLLTQQASYRNNYVPVRELSGAIQQIEKYIFCLNSLGEEKKKINEKLSVGLPDGIIPQVVNPQGILLLGRSINFNERQKRDFEFIKRQYKNIADIMTYDDLMFRLTTIIDSLKKECF